MQLDSFKYEISLMSGTRSYWATSNPKVISRPMEFKIRPYRTSDFKEIHSWWNSANEVAPQEGMMIEDGTFVLEALGVPAITVTVYLTQSKQIAYIEGLIKNPLLKHIDLEPQTSLLMEYICDYARERGYTNLFAYCKVDKLKEKYKRYGLTQVLDNLSAFSRRL